MQPRDYASMLNRAGLCVKSPNEPREVNDCEVFAANGGTSPKAEGAKVRPVIG